MNPIAAPVTLALAAGSALTHEVPAIGVVQSAPDQLIGHVYYKVSTGETVFTPAKEYLANRARASLRAIGDDINGDGTPDVWINTNGDPCPIGTTASPNTNVAALDTETTQGDHHLYKAQGTNGTTDLLVETVNLSFWTDVVDTDTDLDTVPDGNTRGHGFAITFWDREDPFGQTSSFCPSAGGLGFSRERIVTLEVTNLPGPLTAPIPGYMSGFLLTFDLTGGGEFEIADTNGFGPASGFFNPFIAAPDTDTDSDTIPDVSSADNDGNGNIDWSYSFQAFQPTDPGPNEGLIGYQIAAPGRAGAAGEFALDGVTPLNAQAGVPNDGLFDYINRTTDPAPLMLDTTRIKIDSYQAPMAQSFPFTSTALGTTPALLTSLSRFSIFFASLGETPDPAGTGPVPAFSCAGLPNSDFFAWGALANDGVTFVGSLNCVIDDDSDTLPDGRPWSGGYLGLSQSNTVVKCTFADCDCNFVLNLDDIDCFVSAFLSGSRDADCDGSTTINIDDIDCFVATFLAGCP